MDQQDDYIKESPEPDNNYEFLFPSATLPLMQSKKENLVASPGFGPLAPTLKDLAQSVQSLCKKHLQAVQQLVPEISFEEKSAAGLEERLPTIEETEEEDTFRKQARETQQLEVAKIKSCVSATLEKDFSGFNQLLMQLKKTEKTQSSEEKTKKMQEELRLSHKKLALLIQENQEIRRQLDAKGETAAEMDSTAKLMKEVECLKQQLVAGSKGALAEEVAREVKKMLSARNETTAKLRSEKETLAADKAALEEKYKELSTRLTELSETMELVEGTNKELVGKIEQQERERAAMQKQYQSLQGEVAVKNDALEKAQKVIKELYQECRKGKKSALPSAANVSTSVQPVQTAMPEMKQTDDVVSLNVDGAAKDNTKEKEMETQVAALTKELEEIRGSDTMKEAEIRRLQQAVEDSRAHESRMRTEYEATTETLKRAAEKALRRADNTSSSAQKALQFRKQVAQQKNSKSCIIISPGSPSSGFSPCSPIPVSRAECIITCPRETACKADSLVADEADSQSLPGADEKSQARIEDEVPTIKLLLGELEKQYKSEYTCKKEYCTILVGKLEEHKKVVGEILRPVQLAEKQMAEAPTRNKEVYGLVSELFHMLDQYGKQAQSFGEALWNKKCVISGLEEENAGLRERLQDFCDVETKMKQETETREREMETTTAKERTELETAIKKCAETEDQLRRTQEELKPLREFKEILCRETNLESAGKLLERFRALLATEGKCNEMEKELVQHRARLGQDDEKSKTHAQNLELLGEMLKDKEKMILTLGEEVTQLRKQIASIGESRAELDLKRGQVQTAEARLAVCTQELEKEKAEGAQLAAKLKRTEEALSMDRQTLQDKLEEQTDNVLYYKTSIEQRELEIHNLKLHIDSLRETTQKEFEQEIDTLKTELARSQTEYQNLLVQTKEQTQSAEELKQRVLEMVKGNQQAEERCQQLRKTCSDLEAELGARRRTGSFQSQDFAPDASGEVKTLKMILLEKCNYITQLETHLDGIKQKQTESFGEMENEGAVRKAMTVAKCSDCGKWREQFQLADKKSEKYKHKFMKRVKEFEIILKHIEQLLKIRQSLAEPNPETDRQILHICKNDAVLKQWLETIEALIVSSSSRRQNAERHYFDFLTYVLASLDSSAAKKERVRKLLEKAKTNPKVDTMLPEMEKVAADELQQYMRMHTKCYLSVYNCPE